MLTFDNDSSQFILVKNTPWLFFYSEWREASNHLTVSVRIVLKGLIDSETKLLVDRVKVDWLKSGRDELVIEVLVHVGL